MSCSEAKRKAGEGEKVKEVWKGTRIVVAFKGVGEVFGGRRRVERGRVGGEGSEMDLKRVGMSSSSRRTRLRDRAHLPPFLVVSR